MTSSKITIGIIVGLLKVVTLLSLLYLFVCSLTFLTDAFRLIAGKAAGSVFTKKDILSNPFVGLMIGILFTILVQSSSTCTSVAVSIVASETINVEIAIPIVMGANIGTSMTSTLVSLTHFRDREQFERAFTAATLQDCFNWLSVVLLLIIEQLTGYLYYISGRLVHLNNNTGTASAFLEDNLLTAITKPFTDKVIKLDMDILTCWEGKGEGKCQDERLLYNCSKLEQNLPNTTYITAIDEREDCPFLSYLSSFNDSSLGLILFISSGFMLTLSLIWMVKILTSLLEGTIWKVLQKFINSDFPCVPWLTGYLAIFIGAILTFLIQSSSVFTSALTPLAAVGLITVDRVYPLTLGSNIGTTTTALLAAFASGNTNSLQLALCHVIFNVTGVLVFYPIPAFRLPLVMGKKLGKITAKYRWFPIFYIITVFLVVPGSIFGLSLAGTTPLLLVTGIFVLCLICVVMINLLQNHKPNWLPAKLKTWDFLPMWMHSLQPFDNVISKIASFCCFCKVAKKDNVDPELELN